VNLAASYDITKAVQLFGSVTNLFDSNPPVAPSSVGGFNPVLYDPIGRQYHLGARVKF
jgi:iron complex outermembrane recepter protein